MDGLLLVVYGLIVLYVSLSIIVLFTVVNYKHAILRKRSRQDQLLKEWKNRVEGEGDLILLPKDIELLKDSDYLLTFIQMIKSYQGHPQIQNKIQHLADTYEESWLELGHYYAGKSTVLKTYFAWFCTEINIHPKDDNSPMITLMQTYLSRRSLYRRNKALRALSSFGNIKGVLDSYLWLSKEQEWYHPSFVADELSHFQGDKQTLVNALWENFSSFDIPYQIGMVDFFYKEGEHLKGDLIHLLEDPDLNRNLAAALMRYYRKYPVQIYKEVFLKWASVSSLSDWEIKAVTVLTLSGYPGQDTIDILKKCLQSDNWFIRKNAAISLDLLNVTDPQIQEVLFLENTEAIDQITSYLASKE